MTKDYNTSRSNLILPEYGRNIQQLIDIAVKIEDSEKRNRFVQNVISLMGDMYPHLRDVPDFKHKLWDHLAIMSNFKLDIETPYPQPDKETLYKKPEKINYVQSQMRFKHYGKIILKMIKYAVELPEGDEKIGMLTAIANHMKKQYLTWNRETVEDDVILSDLQELSRHLITDTSEIKLSDAKDLVFTPKRQNIPQSKNKKSKNKSKKSRDYK
jgi:hypothetical protein